jgi:hypothetical protein
MLVMSLLWMSMSGFMSTDAGYEYVVDEHVWFHPCNQLCKRVYSIGDQGSTLVTPKPSHVTFQWVGSHEIQRELILVFKCSTSRQI